MAFEWIRTILILPMNVLVFIPANAILIKHGLYDGRVIEYSGIRLPPGNKIPAKRVAAVRRTTRAGLAVGDLPLESKSNKKGTKLSGEGLMKGIHPFASQ